MPTMAIGHSCKRELNVCSSSSFVTGLVDVLCFLAIMISLKLLFACIFAIRFGIRFFKYQCHENLVMTTLWLPHQDFHLINENDLKIHCNFPLVFGGYEKGLW